MTFMQKVTVGATAAVVAAALGASWALFLFPLYVLALLWASERRDRRAKQPDINETEAP